MKRIESHLSNLTQACEWAISEGQRIISIRVRRIFGKVRRIVFVLYTQSGRIPAIAKMITL